MLCAQSRECRQNKLGSGKVKVADHRSSTDNFLAQALLPAPYHVHLKNSKVRYEFASGRYNSPPG